jgi:hypothetical protein
LCPRGDFVLPFVLIAYCYLNVVYQLRVIAPNQAYLAKLYPTVIADRDSLLDASRRDTSAQEFDRLLAKVKRNSSLLYSKHISNLKIAAVYWLIPTVALYLVGAGIARYRRSRANQPKEPTSASL